MQLIPVKELPLNTMFKLPGSETIYTKKSYVNRFTGKASCTYIPSSVVGTKKFRKICYRQIGELTEVEVIKLPEPFLL